MIDVLKLESVSAGYGEAVVLNGVSFTLQPGDRVTIRLDGVGALVNEVVTV